MTARRSALAAAALLALASCSKRPPTPPNPRYVVGAGYQAGPTWFYPREDFHYDATGIAAVQPAASGLTANGEVIDGAAATAAHQTLQLPAIARVTNLDTGAQLLLRINDRGPSQPGRIIALSPRAATLLGVQSAARVRIQVDEGMSAALRDQLQGGPRVAVAAAPRTAVTSETLAPPQGAGQSARGRTAGPTRALDTSPQTTTTVPDRLPETVTSSTPVPGRLIIRAGSFGQAQYARQLETRLAPIGARTEQTREGHASRFDVVSGPYPDIPAADSALLQALRVTPDARITVE